MVALPPPVATRRSGSPPLVLAGVPTAALVVGVPNVAGLEVVGVVAVTGTRVLELWPLGPLVGGPVGSVFVVIGGSGG